MQKYSDERLKGLHAEVSACLNGPNTLKGTTLYVCRLLSNGEFALAKPCTDCQQILDSFGVSKVYYTIDDETYGIWKPN